ncbi:unnamed protein product [Lathyrus sativus]|nr:unnamed protein product [Lathyrus sativus]
MDSQNFVYLFLFILVALNIWRNLKKKGSTPNLPPGPWKLPIIGHIHHLVTSTPHRKLRDLAKIHGPLMHLQLGEIFAVVVSSPEYAKEVLKVHDIVFASRPKILAAEILTYGCTNISFSPYGNYWRKVRKICTMELLTQKRVSSFHTIREEVFMNLIKRIIDSQKGSGSGSAINITQLVASSTFAIITKAALGDKCKVQEELAALGNGESVAGGFDIGELFPSAKWLQLVSGLRPKLERLHRQVDELLEKVIFEHKEEKLKANQGQGDEVEEDLVNILLNYQGGNDSDYKGGSLEYIPFGAGRRMCPGITFGLMNVELALALLLYHFDWKFLME